MPSVETNIPVRKESETPGVEAWSEPHPQFPLQTLWRDPWGAIAPYMHMPHLPWRPPPDLETLPLQRRQLCEIKNGPNNFTVKLDVSQYAPDELEVKTQKDEVIIKGEHTERRASDFGYVSRSFSRRFVLPEGAHADEMSARLNHGGILELVVPKEAEHVEGERKIPIQESAKPPELEKRFGLKSNKEAADTEADANPLDSFSFSATKEAGAAARVGTESDAKHRQDQEGDECTADFTPVVDLPPEADVVTGEESEQVLYRSGRTRLYRMVEGQWKERAVGEFRILTDPETAKTRCVMRQEKTGKVRCNHLLTAGMKLTRKTDTSFIWGADDFSERQLQHETFCLRHKTEDAANEFSSAFEAAVKSITPGASPLQGLADTSPVASSGSDSSTSSKNVCQTPNGAEKPDTGPDSSYFSGSANHNGQCPAPKMADK